ncbi:MAG: ATP-binding protein [Anaerolineales bacterium]
MTNDSPEKQLIQAGRKTRDALRVLRDIVRQQRKQDIYDRTFAQLDSAVEEATDGLIEISNIFEIVLRQPHSADTSHDVANLHELQRSLADMKAEREELIGDLQSAKEQLQKYADDLQKLYSKEREKRAELAQAYERLQQADRLKSDFLSTVNHELTSPLVPIDLIIQVVQKETNNDEQNASLQEARNHLGRYKRQLDGLVKYASLVSQSHLMMPRPLMVANLLTDTLDPLHRLSKSRNIQMSMEVTPPDLTLVADEDLMTGVVYQLADNAIKFNQPGGTVNITAVPQDEGVVFRFEDDGAGIPDEVMRRFGEDFNQIVDAVKRGVEGLGLGLALAKYVAETHQGHLAAQPATPKGTIVELWIPHQAPTEP